MDDIVDLSEAPSPMSPMLGPHSPLGHRVRKVSALSDFAPVNQRIKRYVIVMTGRSASAYVSLVARNL